MYRSKEHRLLMKAIDECATASNKFNKDDAIKRGEALLLSGKLDKHCTGYIERIVADAKKKRDNYNKSKAAIKTKLIWQKQGNERISECGRFRLAQVYNLGWHAFYNGNKIGFYEHMKEAKMACQECIASNE